jgi:hypothetical protein
MLLDNGGAVLRLRRDPEGALFPLGKVAATAGAVGALAAAGEHAAAYLARHARGDWGLFGRFDEIQLTEDERQRGHFATDDDGMVNKSNALGRRGAVTSEYVTGRGERLWVITHLDGNAGYTHLRPRAGGAPRRRR